MLIAQLSDVHVGGSRYRQELLHAAIAEVNAAEPDLVVVAGDITDDGYPDQYPQAQHELSAIECSNLVLVPGNHDARNVGYIQFEDTFGTRDSRLELDLDGATVAVVAVDSSKPDLDEGEIGRERNQVLDAGDVLALLRRCQVDLVLAGHRHVPYVWPVGGMFLVHSGTVSTLRTRGFPHPAYNLIRIENGRIAVELRIPGEGGRSLGEYPRDWPAELVGRQNDLFADTLVRPDRATPLAND